MPKVLVNDENLTNIANAIREKNGETTTYKPSEMATAIQNIETGGGSSITKGLIINEWNSNGFPTDLSLVGMTYVPTAYFSCYNSSSYEPFFERVKKISLPSEITTIKKNAFYGCTGLTSIELPSGITQIEDAVFYDCTGLTSIELPSGITQIASDLFYDCTGLTSIELPSSLTAIGGSAFNGCSALALTELPSSLTAIGRYAFKGCSALALTELPSSLTTIGESAFNGCSALALTELPSSLTTLNKGTFSRCTGLTTINIPSGLTTLTSGIFGGCTGLTEVNILGDVTTMSAPYYDGSFMNCSNLTKITFPNVTAVPAMSSYGDFGSTPIANGTGYIYVPDDLVDSFKTATNWSTYADQIKPISELEASA